MISPDVTNFSFQIKPTSKRRWCEKRACRARLQAGAARSACGADPPGDVTAEMRSWDLRPEVTWAKSPGRRRIAPELRSAQPRGPRQKSLPVRLTSFLHLSRGSRPRNTDLINVFAHLTDEDLRTQPSPGTAAAAAQGQRNPRSADVRLPVGCMS